MREKHRERETVKHVTSVRKVVCTNMADAQPAGKARTLQHVRARYFKAS